MLGRYSSLLVLIGLFFSVFAMPGIAYASGSSPVSAIGTLDGYASDVHESGKADPFKGTDKGAPFHAVGHHHCSIALHLDAPQIKLTALANGELVRPMATTPLASHSQAPPLDPPLA